MENTEVKTISADEFFKSKEFDPSIYEEFAAAIRAGKRVNVKISVTWPKEKGWDIIDETCSTLREFDSACCDIFIRCIEPQHDTFVFGLSGRRNPIKEPAQIYYDGLVFGLCREEYIQTLREYIPARILSLAKHYNRFEGDGVLNVKIID